MKMTQKEMVFKHLQEFGSITSWEAIMEYGATRLSDIIYRLRNDGYNIKSETVSTKNRYGEHTHFAKYILKGEENE